MTNSKLNHLYSPVSVPGFLVYKAGLLSLHTFIHPQGTYKAVALTDATWP